MVADRCRVCGGATSGELCRLHLEAKRRLERHFEVWKLRMGVSWQEYLKMVQANPSTGSAVREVAAHCWRSPREGAGWTAQAPRLGAQRRCRARHRPCGARGSL